MPSGSGTFTSGQVAMTGAAVQLSSLPKNVAAVVLKNAKTSVNSMWIGSSTVSNTTGYELAPGESLQIAIINPGRVYAIGTAAERLCWATAGA